ncbi:putative type I restriction enzyme specificity protein [Mycoplasmoides pneumoniae]|nr:putative type I restriction enzyme specificity protein [Mycoplasmoides pneumoniae]
MGRIKTYDFDGEYVTWTTRWSYAGSIYYRNGKFSASSNCGILKVLNKEINPKFLAYALKKEAKKFVNTTSAIPILRTQKVVEIPIDFPPLQIQEKIATILDTFTELSAELRERKKQYAFYCDYLLNPKNWKEENKYYKLGEIAQKVLVGGEKPADFSKEKNEVYKYPILSNNSKAEEFLVYSKTFRVEEKSITVSARGTIGAVFYRDFAYLPAVSLICFVPKEEFDIRFLFHALRAIKFKKQGSATGQLTVAQFKEYGIHVPSLKKQKEIAAILDPLYSFFTDLNEGIPAEIELCKKQLDYYQNFLFNWVQNQKAASIL